MAVYLLDTNILIDALNAKRDRGKMLHGLLREGNLLACCGITVTEVYAGMRAHEEIRTAGLLSSMQYYPVTLPVARLAGLLKGEYARKGVTLATTDVAIAAVAIHYQLTLITRNLRHYPMRELQIHPLPPT
jgi:predicted nucleic acid-binding protein